MALEVMPDHLRLFVETDPKNSPSYVADQFKGFTSHHARAYAKASVSVRYADQSAELKHIRADDTGWSFSSQQATLRRLDKAFRAFFDRLAEAQRDLARERRGSQHRRKAVARVAALHAKVRRRRIDHTRKIANVLVPDNDVIVHEDLRIANMTRSASGTVDQPGRKNRLTQAGFACTACAHAAHADVNAAVNILRAGLALHQAAEAAWREAAPFRERRSHATSLPLNDVKDAYGTIHNP